MLHRILGIACFDPYFLDDLFDDPTAAIRAYNCYARRHDVDLLHAIVRHKPLKTRFEAVAKQICHHPPCPPAAPIALAIVGAALLDQAFCADLFEDAIATANKHGFCLRYPDTYALTTLICGAPKEGARKPNAHKAALKEAIDALRQEIGRILEKAEIPAAA